MKKADITFLVGSVFMALTSVCYCATLWFSIKIPRYYPLEHTWKWVSEKGVPSQGWYGMQAFAYLAAGLVSLLLYWGLRRFATSPTGLSSGLTKAVAWITLGTVVGGMGYLLCHEFSRWGVFP